MRRLFPFRQNRTAAKARYSVKLGGALLLFIFAWVVANPSAKRAWAADGQKSEDLETLLNSDNVPTPDSSDKPAEPVERALDEVSDGSDKEAAPKFNESGTVGAAGTPTPAPAEGAAPPVNKDEELDLEKALEAEPTKGAPRTTAAEPPPPASSPSSPSPSLDDDTIEKVTPASAAAAQPAPKADVPPATTTGVQTGESKDKNEVTNLEFRMDGEDSKITVSFRGAPNYREVKNPQIKQIIYYFENTETPSRLQRAYDTSEFVSPVTLFTLLQMPENPPQSKLIVQLREDKAPTATLSGNSLVVRLPPSDIKVDAKALAKDDPMNQSEENIYANGKTFSGKNIKLEIKNSEVQDVLRLIAKTSGYNIVVGDDVQGKVGTLSLDNIPWDQAFTLVLQTKKLGYVRQGNVLRVGTLVNLKSEKDESLANENARIKVEPLKTLLIPVSYAKAADLVPRAKSFLSDRGVAEVDIRTNTLIIKDVERMVTKVQKLVAALDTQPPRVSISAKIVEMDTDFTRNIGFSSTNFSPTFGGINLNTSFTSGVSGSAVTTITAPNFANLLATLQLGEVDNRVKTLANPQVSVVANQQATVQQSLAFFIPTTQIVNATPIVTYTQISTNLNMDVTPIVSSDGVIFLTLSVKNETPSGPIDQRTINGRSLNTQIMVDNGDTAVIGGIFNNTLTTNRTGVPFISSIPILGWLFSGNAFEDQKTEIYMFLTAKILNADETFKRAL